MLNWLTVPEAAARSGYHENHLRRLIRAGKVSAQKRGGRWWVDQESLDAYHAQAAEAQDARYGPRDRG